MRERDNNFFMDFEDNGFGGSAMEQNEALANMIQPPAPAKTDYTQALKQQILAQGRSDKWTGQGLGSAEANAADMAKILAGIGITDINQFGPITREVDLYMGEGVDGTPIYQKQTEQTFGNKLTGQAVPNTYSERQKGNFFGGTFAGKGNTGYGVRFDSQGNPIFYTQGASSNDLVNLFQDNPLLGAAAQIAAATFGGPVGSAALAAAMGKSPEDILKSTALSYAGNLAGSAVSGMEGITDVLGKTGTQIAANAAKQYVGSGGNIDPVQALLSSGLNAGINTVATDLGMGDLTPAQQKMLSSGITGVVTGQTPEQIAMNIAMAAATAKPGSSPTSSFDSGNDQPLSPEEQAQLIENRLNTAIGRSQISPEEEEANTQRAIDELESLYGPSSDTRSLAGEPQKEEADDFLKSIGIDTLDKSSDSGLSNQDILNLINADNGMLITANRDRAQALPEHDFYPTVGRTDPKTVEIVGNREPQYLATDNDFMPTPIRDEGTLEVVGSREPKYLPTDDDFMPTPIKDEGVMEIVGNRDKTQEHVFDPTFGGTLPLPEVPATPIPPVATPKVPTPPKASTPSKTTPAASAPSSPFIYQEPVNQNIIPELAKVFYFGKNFGGQQQQLSPEGELLTTPYNQLSVTQAGAEPMPQPIPIAQDAKGGENDISALLQQIMSSGDPNMTQEELMQLIQSRG